MTWGAETTAALERMIADGKSVEAMAAALHMTPGAVRAKRDRILRRGAGGPATAPDPEIVRHAAVVEGRSVQWVARTHGWRPIDVERLMAATGMDVDRRRAVAKLRAERARRSAAIVAARRDGEAVASIAARFGVAVGTVKDLVSTAKAKRPAVETPAAQPPSPTRRTAAIPTRIIGSGYGGSPDVEHADPVRAAADAAPLWGGRYPKAAQRAPFSATGSPGAMCAAAAVGAG